MAEWATEDVRKRYVQGQYAVGAPDAGWRFDAWLSRHDAEVAAKALEAIADEWQMGGWTVVTLALRTLEDRLAAADVMTTWLRARAAAIRAETQREGVGCKHCGRPIAGEGGHIHTAGANRGLHRCDPNDSGLPYGLCAEAVGDACGPICTGGQ